MALPDLGAELAQLEVKGLRRERHALSSPQGPEVRIDGIDYLAFASNDYLGLASHAALIGTARDAAAIWGVGGGSSHLVAGHFQPHHDLEVAFAQFVGLPAALLFSTGYMANLGIVTALVGRGDTVFADRLDHASLNDACLLSRAQFKRFHHNDLSALERLLEQAGGGRKLICVDAVFSMDGDLAPVAALLELAERHDAWLLLDDAHGFGVLGPGGRGILAEAGLQSPHIIYMATLGKAAGVAGAMVAGQADMIDYLANRARTYIYTTSQPPMLAAVLLQSLQLIAAADDRREHLARLIGQLREACVGLPWSLMPSNTAIQPLLVGSNGAALALADGLKSRGLWVPAIRPPTVPAGEARLRISLSALHAPEHVDRLCQALHQLAARIGKA